MNNIIMRRITLILLSLFYVTETNSTRLHQKGNNNLRNNNDDDYGDDSIILLESFDRPSHTWMVQNDPVMGGKSTGNFTIVNGLGKFQGDVVDVPFLHAPGFLQALTKRRSTFSDVSHCHGIQIIARSNIPYTGYRISFGNTHAPGGNFFAYGYKANLNIDNANGDEQQSNAFASVNDNDNEFNTIVIPFDDFTDFWDDATGDPIRTCHENPLYCPNEKTLKNLEHIAIWAEGVAGSVSLDIKSIAAVGCGASRSSNLVTTEKRK